MVYFPARMTSRARPRQNDIWVVGFHPDGQIKGPFLLGLSTFFIRIYRKLESITSGKILKSYHDRNAYSLYL